jgi:hypothetical protein
MSAWQLPPPLERVDGVQQSAPTWCVLEMERRLAGAKIKLRARARHSLWPGLGLPESRPARESA